MAKAYFNSENISKVIDLKDHIHTKKDIRQIDKILVGHEDGITYKVEILKQLKNKFMIV